jgi:hypothetical protein
LQIDALLRETTKHDVYQGREPSEDEYAMAEHLREKLLEFANDNNLTL